MDSDLGNTETTYFEITEPEDQKLDRNAEKAKVMEGLALLEDIISHFTDQIAHYESTKSVPKEVMTKPDEFMHVIASNDLTADNLRQVRTYLEGLRDTYSR
jgi:folate-dependent tRNA-U54 methylase TrmFO/GidA